MCLILVCVSFSPSRAESGGIVDRVSPETIRRLSEDPIWHKLLVYGSDSRSQVSSEDFFLADNGATNPRQELIATLKSFTRKAPDNPNDHAQCRFPARYRWLNRHLSFEEMGLTPRTCPDFNEFSGRGRAHSVSLVYASGYLGNPASFYGHLLLKINTSEQHDISDLENTAVNYGAITSPDDHFLEYITKGVLGGYRASFTHQKYYHHTHNYTEEELRDLWEYKLNLGKKDRELLISHAWELIGTKFPYYFLKKNCAYQFGKLLELVTKDPLVHPYQPWETPQGLIQQLDKQTHNGTSLVENINYYPSRQSRLYERYLRLGEREQTVVQDIVSDTEVLDEVKFKGLPLDSRHKVTDTLMDYYQYVAGADTAVSDPRYNRALEKRYQLPPGKADPLFNDEIDEQSPHRGRKPGYASVHAIYNAGRENVDYGVRLRPAYYDSLDWGAGHLENSSLSMGEITVRTSGERVWIDDLNLFGIEHVNRNVTGLPGDRSFSWYLETGAKQRDVSCNDCLSLKANGGMGYAASYWNDSVVTGGYLGSGYLGRTMEQNNFYLSGRVTTNIYFNKRLRFRGEFEHRQMGGFNKDEQVYQAKLRRQINSQNDLRITYEKHVAEEVGISWGIYW